TGLQMSFVPNKNLGFYISKCFLTQGVYESIECDNESKISAKHLAVTNITVPMAQNFIDTLNQLETSHEYDFPSILHMEWLEKILTNQWRGESSFHLGLDLFDFDNSKAFWVRNQNNEIKEYKIFEGFVENVSLEHMCCKLIAYVKK
ncbi:hypothetical protein MJH12_04630, partial [bacterium]|nr:hypothetical protein [bacterium]